MDDKRPNRVKHVARSGKSLRRLGPVLGAMESMFVLSALLATTSAMAAIGGIPPRVESLTNGGAEEGGLLDSGVLWGASPTSDLSANRQIRAEDFETLVGRKLGL